MTKQIDHPNKNTVYAVLCNLQFLVSRFRRSRTVTFCSWSRTIAVDTNTLFQWLRGKKNHEIIYFSEINGGDAHTRLTKRSGYRTVITILIDRSFPFNRLTFRECCFEEGQNAQEWLRKFVHIIRWS